MERSAFSRAKDYLDHRARAKWTAIGAGIAASVLYVGLVLLLALFVDLLVHRGRVENLAQLGVAEQEQFVSQWNALPEEARTAAVDHLGIRDDRERRALIATEKLPPLPGKMKEGDLRHWVDERGPLDESPSIQAMKENELRWRAFVWTYLKDHFSLEAANVYQPEPPPAPVPGLGEENRRPTGVLSLVVRLQGTTAGRMLNLFASWNQWMWGSGTRDANRSYLTGLLILAILMAILRAGCLMLMYWQAAVAAVEGITRLRRAVYHRALQPGDLAFKTNGAADAQGLFTRQIEALHEAIYYWITTAHRSIAQLILLLIIALLVQPWLALAVLLFAILVWLLGGRIVTTFRRKSRASAKVATSRILLLRESIRLMRLVKSYLMELFNQSRVERQLAEYAEAHLTRYRGEAFARPFMLLLVTLAGVTVLYLGGRIVLSDGLSAAGLTILIVSVCGLFMPLLNRIEYQRHERRGQEAAAALFEFIDRPNDQLSLPDAEFLQPIAESLEFKDVSVQEPGEARWLLQNVELTIAVGERVGVVGASEDQKHALIALVSRFIDPTDGEVRIDRRNLRWVSPDSLRAQIGLVLQSDLVFNDTVANNIGCGDPGTPLPRIIEAAKIAHAHQFIQKLPYGYETSIGEIGNSLRMSERFRIALARAIARDPAIFIIEEPLEMLDDDSKALLDDTYSRILAGKTVLMLPHRVSTLKHCDRLIVLHDGMVEAIGDHRELVKASALYKHLYYLEFNAFAEQA